MFGTSVIDMLFHGTVILARRFAILDVLSEVSSIPGLVFNAKNMSTMFLVFPL
jgi:hypothetical protein